MHNPSFFPRTSAIRSYSSFIESVKNEETNLSIPTKLHIPVMAEEVVSLLNPKPGNIKISESNGKRNDLIFRVQSFYFYFGNIVVFRTNYC